MSRQSNADADQVMTRLRTFMVKALSPEGQTNSTYGDLLRMLTGNAKTVDGKLQLTNNFTQLSRCFQAMSKTCSSFDEERHQSILELIYGFSLNAPMSVIREWCSLVANLCVVNGRFLTPVLESLIRSFINKNLLDRLAAEEEAEASSTSTLVASATLASVGELHDAVHGTIHQILRLVPLASSVTFSLIIQNYPHKSVELMYQKVYLKNLLRICEYACSIRDRILTAIIERLLQIDVEIDCDSPSARSMFSRLERAMQSMVRVDGMQDDEDEDHKPRMTSTLDSLMELLLQYLGLVGSCLHQKLEVDMDMQMVPSGADMDELDSTISALVGDIGADKPAAKIEEDSLGLGIGFGMMDDEEDTAAMDQAIDETVSGLFSPADLASIFTPSAVKTEVKTEVTPNDNSLLSQSTLETRISNAAAAAAMPDVKLKSNKEDEIGFAFEVFLEQQNNESGTTSETSKLADEIFSSLLRVFHRTILRAHNSHFVQFLVFFQCQFKFEYAEILLRLLMDKVLSSDTNMLERSSATMYIASFVARAKYLRQASAASALQLLLQFAINYANTYTPSVDEEGLFAPHTKKKKNKTMPSVSEAEANNHVLFYAVCEAIFYIFTKRQDLLQQFIPHVPSIDSPVIPSGSSFHSPAASPVIPRMVNSPNVNTTLSPLLGAVNSPSLAPVPLLLPLNSTNSQSPPLTQSQSATVVPLNSSLDCSPPSTHPSASFTLTDAMPAFGTLSGRAQDPLMFGVLINSPLNPLLYCSPNLTMRFTDLVTKLGLVDCSKRVQSNAVLTGATKSDGTKTGASGLYYSSLAIYKSGSTTALSRAHMPFDAFFLPSFLDFFPSIYLTDRIKPKTGGLGMGMGLARGLQISNSHTHKPHKTKPEDDVVVEPLSEKKSNQGRSLLRADQPASTTASPGLNANVSPILSHVLSSPQVSAADDESVADSLELEPLPLPSMSSGKEKKKKKKNDNVDGKPANNDVKTDVEKTEKKKKEGVEDKKRKEVAEKDAENIENVKKKRKTSK